MKYPHFIAIDGSSYEEEAHPIAIAWSLDDGSIKTTLVQPEDDWEDWDYALEDLHGITQDTLFQRGETGWSVIRELEHDLEQPFLIAEDMERVTQLLDKLYDSCGREVSMEIGRLSDEISNASSITELYEDLDFSHQPCDERVRLMLELWARDNT